MNQQVIPDANVLSWKVHSLALPFVHGASTTERVRRITAGPPRS